MLKTITLKMVSEEIGASPKRPPLPSLTKQQMFLLVYGAAEWLGDEWLAKGRVDEVQLPSNAALKKLAAQLVKRAQHVPRNVG